MRVGDAIDKRLTIETLKNDEQAARRRFAADLQAGKWLSTFRGRDVLKQFVADHVSGVNYEAFRDLVLARMRDANFKPEGMKEVLDAIVTSRKDFGERLHSATRDTAAQLPKERSQT